MAFIALGFRCQMRCCCISLISGLIIYLVGQDGQIADKANHLRRHDWPQGGTEDKTALTKTAPLDSLFQR